MKNLKIRTKLLAGFGAVLAMTVVMGVMGIAGMNHISSGNDTLYEQNCKALFYMSGINLYFQQYRANMQNAILRSSLGNVDKAVTSKEQAEADYAKLIEALAGYETTPLTEEEKLLYSDLTSILLGPFKQKTEEAMSMALREDIRGAADALDVLKNDYLVKLDIVLSRLMNLNNNSAEANARNNERLSLVLTAVAVALLVATALIGLFFTLVLTSLTILYSKTSGLVGIVSYALLFLTGALIPLTSLPWVLRGLAYGLPLTGAITAGRSVLDGVGLSGWSYAVIVVEALGYLVLGAVVFRLVMRRAMRRGIAVGY